MNSITVISIMIALSLFPHVYGAPWERPQVAPFYPVGLGKVSQQDVYVGKSQEITPAEKDYYAVLGRQQMQQIHLNDDIDINEHERQQKVIPPQKNDNMDHGNIDVGISLADMARLADVYGEADDDVDVDSIEIGVDFLRRMELDDSIMHPGGALRPQSGRKASSTRRRQEMNRYQMHPCLSCGQRDVPVPAEPSAGEVSQELDPALLRKYDEDDAFIHE